jgi:hypothetical protein
VDVDAPLYACGLGVLCVCVSGFYRQSGPDLSKKKKAEGPFVVLFSSCIAIFLVIDPSFHCQEQETPIINRSLLPYLFYSTLISIQHPYIRPIVFLSMILYFFLNKMRGTFCWPFSLFPPNDNTELCLIGGGLL